MRFDFFISENKSLEFEFNSHENLNLSFFINSHTPELSNIIKKELSEDSNIKYDYFSSIEDITKDFEKRVIKVLTYINKTLNDQCRIATTQSIYLNKRIDVVFKNNQFELQYFARNENVKPEDFIDSAYQLKAKRYCFDLKGDTINQVMEDLYFRAKQIDDSMKKIL